MQLGHFREQVISGGKRERTRAALLDAAVKVVAEKGMEALKISDVTTAADLANGTFYNHFADKDEMLREAANGIALAIGRQLDAEMVGITDAPTRVVRATASFIDIVLRELDWAAVMLAGTSHVPQLNHDVAAYLRSDLKLGVDQGKFDVELTPFLIQQIIALISVTITMQRAEGLDRRLTHQACENILRLLGISPAKARKIVATTLKTAQGAVRRPSQDSS